MPDADERRSYPSLPPSHWWKLRTKFNQSIPPVVTDGYLASVLQMAESSARSNVTPYLKAFGLLNQDGKPTDLVKQWRDDEGYASSCKTILQSTYPEELIHAISDVSTGRRQAERWFQNKGGVGQNAAGKMASIFMVIYAADLTQAPNERKTASAPKKAAKKTDDSVKRVNRQKVDNDSGNPNNGDSGQHRQRANGPDVNINLQIHISADASADQIEQIFQSMSKYLYKNG